MYRWVRTPVVPKKTPIYAIVLMLIAACAAFILIFISEEYIEAVPFRVAAMLIGAAAFAGLLMAGLYLLDRNRCIFDPAAPDYQEEFIELDNEKININVRRRGKRSNYVRCCIYFNDIHSSRVTVNKKGEIVQVVILRKGGVHKQADIQGSYRRNVPAIFWTEGFDPTLSQVLLAEYSGSMRFVKIDG